MKTSTIFASLAAIVTLVGGAFGVAGTFVTPHQLTLSSQVEGPFSITDHNGFHRQDITVDQFDPANGTLKLVRARFVYDIEREVFAENTSMASTASVVYDDDFTLSGVQARPWFWECWLEYERQSGRVVRLATSTQTVPAHQFNLGRYDGTLDFAGASGDKETDTKSVDTGYILGNNAANNGLLFFEGTGTVTVTYDSWDQIYSSINGGSVTSGQTLDLTDIDVYIEYLYQ